MSKLNIELVKLNKKLTDALGEKVKIYANANLDQPKETFYSVTVGEDGLYIRGAQVNEIVDAFRRLESQQIEEEEWVRLAQEFKSALQRDLGLFDQF